MAGLSGARKVASIACVVSLCVKGSSVAFFSRPISCSWFVEE